MTLPLIVLRADDAPRLAALHATGFPDAWSTESFASSLAEPSTLGLGMEENRTLIAFALVRIVLGEADLLTIVTAPDRRREGHAAHLLEALLPQLAERGATRFTLEVASGNTSAHALYQRFGFNEDGRRPNYYSAGRAAPEDAILMSRPLAPATPQAAPPSDFA